MRDQLERLKQDVVLRAELKQHLRALEEEKEKLSKEVFSLQIAAHNEQVDVDSLNSFNLKNMYYAMTGKKDELLAKETSEARVAKEKADAAAFHLKQIERQMESDSNTVHALQGCEEAYWNMLQTVVSEIPSENAAWIHQAYQERIEQLIHISETVLKEGYDTIEYSSEVQDNLVNVQDWNRHLPNNAWYLSMPGYLNGAMNKIERFRKQVQKISADLEVLPLPSHVKDNLTDIFVFPQNYFRELTSKISADERLYEADVAIVSAVRRLKDILREVEGISSDLRKKQI